jgi:hypothetical protein
MLCLEDEDGEGERNGWCSMCFVFVDLLFGLLAIYLRFLFQCVDSE